MVAGLNGIFFERESTYKLFLCEQIHAGDEIVYVQKKKR